MNVLLEVKFNIELTFGTCTIKLSTGVINTAVVYVVTANHLHPSVMFVTKVGANPSEPLKGLHPKFRF